MFKIVAVSYAGADTWVHKLCEMTRTENRRSEPHVVEEDAWRCTTFDYVVPGILVEGRAVRFYVFGHEGLGFIGQPGSAKDVVYKNVHAVIALGNTDDAADLAAVVDADLQRLNSQGNTPIYVLAAFPGAKLEEPVKHGVQVDADWIESPRAALKPAMRGILLRYR